jgi:hypothetical protein
LLREWQNDGKEPASYRYRLVPPMPKEIEVGNLEDESPQFRLLPPGPPSVSLENLNTTMPIDPTPSSLPILTMEMVKAAVEKAVGELKYAVPLRVLQQVYLPEYPESKIGQLLSYLVSTKEISSTKVKQANYYFPPDTWAEAPKEKEPDEEVAPSRRRTLGFECEVCHALVGVRAEANPFTQTCASCDSSYYVCKGWAYRLYPPLKIFTWVPEQSNGAA